MAKGNINPEFQAAPFLGGTTYNPIEFQQRHKAIKYQQEKLRQEEIQERTAKGLEKLMIDLEGWEDQEGFKEISADHDKIINAYIELSRRGLNITSPRTQQELMAYKVIMDGQKKVMEKVDARKESKVMFDLWKKMLETDSAKPKEEQKLNYEQSYTNMLDALKTTKVLDRREKFRNLLVINPDKVDLLAEINKRKDFYEKPTQVQTIIPNPETGGNEIRLTEKLTPEQEKENVRRAGIHYEELTQPYKDAVKKLRDNDPDPQLNIMPVKDYFATLAVPQFKERFLEKPVGTGGGLMINIGGSKVQMQPGTLRPEPLPYGEGEQGKTYVNSYWFPVPGKSITVPVGASGSAQFLGTGWSPITRGGSVEATLYLYDPEKDEFVFNVTSNQQAPWVQNNRPVSIPRSVIGNILDDVPIKKDGKVIKLKDIYKTISTPQTKSTGIKWSAEPWLPRK